MMSRHWSRVIRIFIVGKIRSETEGEVVIPAGDLTAQVGDLLLIKPVFSKVFIAEDADPGEVVPDCLQVEFRIVAAGKILKVGI